jgi:polysaccharide biosynthesis transport protein
MSANFPPALPGPQSTAVEPYAPGHPGVTSRGPDVAVAPAAEEDAFPIGRILSALGRYKWLILIVLILGSIGGVAATRFISPRYQVNSTILLTGAQSGARAAAGPIRVEQEFDPQGWIDLLRSFAIADSVVMQLALYVKPDRAEDAPLFRDFAINRQRFIPGEYTLSTKGVRYTLRDKIGIVSESGTVSDSVGRTAGFIWRPGRAQLGGDRTVKFRVQTPRETSVEILRRLNIGLARGSNLINVQLTGTVQERPAATLNAWGEQFVRIATDLKSGRINQFSKILNAQRAEAADRLAAAEQTLQSFRVNAITKPSEGTPVQPGSNGLELSRDPALESYFRQKQYASTLRRDRELLERVATQVTPTNTPMEALFAVQTVTSDPIAGPLRTALEDYMKLESTLRMRRQVYTDSEPTIVKPLLAQTQALQALIPVQLAEVLKQMREREASLEAVLASSERDLQGIPARTINEEALRREVQSASLLYTTLQQRYAEAELSEKSTIPDVRVLDAAVMPLAPTTNTVPKIIAAAVGASLGIALGLAILLDRVDRRFRYPSQAANLGLEILGVVPVVDQSRRQSPEKVAQIVEAFRSIRMNVRYASMPDGHVMLTVTSPGPDDGKSFVASNLALSFAEGGWRTVLIDADLRRGQLNTTFDLPSAPGLVEHLEGTSLLSEVLLQTSHENLLLLPSGTRHRRGPELLATPRMQELVARLGREYDAIIVDTPPLGAGTDAYAVGATTGDIAIVFRSGMTDLKMAQAKLRVLDNLPVRVVGAVLNSIATEGAYQYYSYDPDYVVVEESAPVPQLTATAGER